VVAEPESSTQLTSKPTVGHDPEIVSHPTSILISHFPKINLEVMLPSPSQYSKWKFSRRFPPAENL
jgi:hypothetical protein